MIQIRLAVVQPEKLTGLMVTLVILAVIILLEVHDIMAEIYFALYQSVHGVLQIHIDLYLAPLNNSHPNKAQASQWLYKRHHLHRGHNTLKKSLPKLFFHLTSPRRKKSMTRMITFADLNVSKKTTKFVQQELLNVNEHWKRTVVNLRIGEIRLQNQWKSRQVVETDDILMNHGIFMVLDFLLHDLKRLVR